MATPITVTVTLDRPREIAWTTRARIRLNSLPRPANRAGIYQVAALLWAMVGDDVAFPAPEDLGEYLDTAEKMRAVTKALLAAQDAAEDSEKNGRGSTQKPARASSSK